MYKQATTVKQKETQMAKQTEAKLEFKPVTGGAQGSATFVRAAQLKAGDIAAEGIYAGSQPNTFNKDKSDYRIEDIKDSSKVTIVNGAGNLGFQMSKVNPGDIVQILYNGKQKLTKGTFAGKETHSFTVSKA